MTEQPLSTQFAPAERVSADKLREQIIKFADIELLHRLVDRSPDIFLVMNKERPLNP